jgi:alkylation response protein AidB-like acyl-CoA dehydrogenase
VRALDPLTDEQREIRELVRTIARERIAPRAAEIDKSAEFPWDVVEVFRENDVFGVMYDEVYGGIGESSLMTLGTIEELSKVCATSGLIIAVQELGSLGIKLAGSEEQKQRFLPKLASGEWLAAYALTEPGSGSDSAAMRTTAVLDGDAYVLNGGKRFITNAGVASLYVAFAKTNPEAGHGGISAFVVEADAPGFEVGRIEPKMGIKGSTTGEVFFNDCRVPAANLLGWHAETRTLLVVELKTAIVDANEMVGSMDRRRRLAVRIARERGWEAAAVATWVLVSDTRANRRRLADHVGLLRTAFPADGRAMRRWLGHPVAAVAALSFLSPDRNTRDKHTSRVPRRVRVPRVRSGRRRNARGSRGMLRSARISHERQESVGPGSGARQSSGQARPRPRRSWSATMRRWIWFVPS